MMLRLTAGIRDDKNAGQSVSSFLFVFLINGEFSYTIFIMKYLQPVFAFPLMILIAVLVSCAGVITKTPAQTEFDLGLSLFNRGHYEGAIPHLERATEYEPEFGRAYLYLARSYINLGRWREALQPLRTAFRLSPEETRKEISEIIMDAVIQSQADPDAQLQFQNILREK